MDHVLIIGVSVSYTRTQKNLPIFLFIYISMTVYTQVLHNTDDSSPTSIVEAAPRDRQARGRPETVKDLGKGLGMYVIVINCSEGLDYKSNGSNVQRTGPRYIIVLFF